MTKPKAVWFLYMLKCADGSLYTGVTLDIDRRMREHAAGKGSRYVYSRLPIELIYQENFPDKRGAFQREAQIKSFSRKEKVLLIGCRVKRIGKEKR